MLAERAFRAIGERLKQISQLGVAMLFHEPRHIVSPATAARLADDRQRGVAKVGQDERAVSGHGPYLQPRHDHVTDVGFVTKSCDCSSAARAQH